MFPRLPELPRAPVDPPVSGSPASGANHLAGCQGAQRLESLGAMTLMWSALPSALEQGSLESGLVKSSGARELEMVFPMEKKNQNFPAKLKFCRNSIFHLNGFPVGNSQSVLENILSEPEYLPTQELFSFRGTTF